MFRITMSPGLATHYYILRTTLESLSSSTTIRPALPHQCEPFEKSLSLLQLLKCARQVSCFVQYWTEYRSLPVMQLFICEWITWACSCWNVYTTKYTPLILFKGTVQRYLTGVETRLKWAVLKNYIVAKFAFWILKEYHHEMSIKLFSAS